MPTYNLRYIISSVITKGNVLMMFDCKANDAKNYQSVIHGEVRKCRLLETITEMLRWILRYGREGCTYIPASPDIENDNASIDRIIYLHTENTTFAIYNVLHDIAHYIKFLLTQVRSKWGTNGTWRSLFYQTCFLKRINWLNTLHFYAGIICLKKEERKENRNDIEWIDTIKVFLKTFFFQS